MTKKDIDRLFELLDNGDIEALFELLADDELKEKAKQYENLEEFFNEETLYRQIPPELLEYYCEKAIDTNNLDFILDEKTKDDSIKKYEAKVERIIKSDEATRLKFVEDADDSNKYAIKVVQSLSDDNKLRVIRSKNSIIFKSEVSKKIEDTTIKLKAIEEIDEKQSDLRAEVVLTIDNDNIRFNAIDLIKNDIYKAEIAKSINENQELKLQAMDKIEDSFWRKEVALTIDNPTIKLKSLEKIENDSQRVEIAITIDDPKLKLEALDKFDSENTYLKKKVAISIDSVDYRLKSLEKFEASEDKLEIVESLFSEEEIMELSERDFTEEQKDIVDAIKRSKNKIIMENIVEIGVENAVENAKKELEESEDVFLIGLPENMTIGVELEAEGEFSNIFMEKEVAPGWKGTSEGSLEHGVEVNSPVLNDTDEDMKMLEAICNTMRNTGLITTEKCGGHIHLGVDYFEGNHKAFENLSNIWYQCEELFYKMANEKGNVPREGIAKFAKTMHKELEPFLEKEIISINSLSEFENMRKKIVEKEQKNRGLNLGHYGEDGKNTIEFRIPNGTINPKTVKENIMLFGSLMQVSKEMALNPEYKKEEFETVMDKGLSEGEKVEELLNLLFDDEKTKDIYRGRWESVRDEKIFDQITDGQTATFKRGDYSIYSKQDIEQVAISEEAIEQMSGVSEEIRREVKEREQQNQVSNNTSIEDSADPRY